MTCNASQWLNGSACANCSACASPNVTAIACTRLADAVCRMCTSGFVAVDDACVPEPEHTETHQLLMFFIIVVEILVCACSMRCVRKNRYSLLG